MSINCVINVGVPLTQLVESDFTSLDNKQAFLGIGQSNMQGKGDSLESPAVTAGEGYNFDDNEFSTENWDYTVQFEDANDPVGPADTGSIWPAFVNAFFADTGRVTMINNQAIGGTSLVNEVSANWSDESYLWTEAVRAARRMLHYSQIPKLRGVLMSQGESDAVRINSAEITKEDYKNALISLINRSKLEFPGTPFYIIATNNHPRGTESQQAWDDIRDAQFEVCDEIDNVFMAFPDTNLFTVANGKLQADETHYTQTGLNEIGTSLGAYIPANGYTMPDEVKQELSFNHLSVNSRHRGVLDGSQIGTADYDGRPTAQWNNYITISIKVDGPVKATINWGDTFSRIMTYDLTVSGTGATGYNNLKFMFLTDEDTLPENPIDPVADHIPPIKTPIVQFDYPGSVLEIRFNKAEIVDLMGDFRALNIIYNIVASAQLLESLPLFPSTLQALNVGASSGLWTNQSYGNKLSFADIDTSLTSAKASLTKLITGDENAPEIIGIDQYINDPGADQTYDLSTYTALEEAYLHLSRITKLITTVAGNTNLRILKNWGNNTVRPNVDVTEMEIPASLETIDFSSSQNVRSTKVTGAILFSTAVALNNVDVRDCFYLNSTDMEQTIINFHAAKANLPDGGTFNIAGQNPAVSVSGQSLLDEFTNEKGWTVTYNV